MLDNEIVTSQILREFCSWNGHSGKKVKSLQFNIPDKTFINKFFWNGVKFAKNEYILMIAWDVTHLPLTSHHVLFLWKIYGRWCITANSSMGGCHGGNYTFPSLTQVQEGAFVCRSVMVTILLGSIGIP